jgi:O-methyltransferase involved in polyketide biosynthesis
MNKGNEKISVTAEFVSIMRAKSDPRNLYFVSPKGQRLFNLTRKVFSEKKLNSIFEWRLKLSKIFDDKILIEKPEQVIDLAAGYSLRGFNECLKNENLIYIDVDFNSVLSRKKLILNSICKKEGILFPRNYFFVSTNLLKSNIFENMKNIVSQNKKTLIFAEGLTSYFNWKEFKLFLQNIKSFINNFDNVEFCSHENIQQPKGFVYFLLRYLFVSLLTKSKRRGNFKSEKELEVFLKNEGFNNFKVSTNQGFIIYSIRK